MQKMIRLYETSKDSNNRITEIPVNEVSSKADLQLELDDKSTFQLFKGFGGAVTESSGFVLNQLSKENQEKILKAYFDSVSGNGYTFARTHMNSCDFSLENWACASVKDENLSNFSMDRTNQFILPVLKAADSISQHKLKLLISPWSPPAWMKDNNDMNHGGKILPEYKKLWALYFCKFIKALQENNLTVDHVTIQNEPAAKQVWDSCLWSAKEEGEFAVNYLYPAFVENNIENVKILVWDHNRDLLKERFETSMTVKGADKAISGAAFHWYADGHFDQLAYLSKKYPDKEFFFTEGCIEGGPQNGKWHTGERYGHNIINDLNNGCNAWIDWNILLNMEGGPNHVGNYCDSPVLADPEKGNYYFQSSYYYIGHFSRFIKPGARRIYTFCTKEDKNLEYTSFKNDDGKIAFVIMNNQEKDKIYSVKIKNEQKTLKIPAHSIQTLVVE